MGSHPLLPSLCINNSLFSHLFISQISTSLFFLVTKTLPKVAVGSFLPVMLYVVVIATISITQYTAVTFIPVASAHSVFVTITLTSGLVLFTLIAKEKMRIDRPLAVFVCIAGVLLVLQPTFLFHNSNQENGHYPKVNVSADVNATISETVSTVR